MAAFVLKQSCSVFQSVFLDSTVCCRPGGESENMTPPIITSSEHRRLWRERHSFGSTEQKSSELSSETVAPRQLKTRAAPGRKSSIVMLFSRQHDRTIGADLLNTRHAPHARFHKQVSGCAPVAPKGPPMTRVCVETRNARDAMNIPYDARMRRRLAPERRRGSKRRRWRPG